MCGIAGIHRRTNRAVSKVGTLADELLLEIEHRGVHSTGYLAMLDNGRVQIHKAAQRASKFVPRRRRFARDARTILLHTRFATIGTVNDTNAHPVVSGRTAAVHNGTIYNHRAVFDAIDRKRNATVDSEAIPAVVDAVGWDDAASALALLHGGAATAIVNADHPTEVLLARLTKYPLVVMITRDVVVWASTRRAIESAWHHTYGRSTPRAAEWRNVEANTMIRVNGKVTTEPIPVPKTKTEKRPKGRVGGGTTAKARRKRAARANQLPLVVTRPTDPPEWVEDWMDDAVSTLMRVEGYSRQDAEEMVYGTTVTDDREVDWSDLLDDILLDID